MHTIVTLLALMLVGPGFAPACSFDSVSSEIAPLTAAKAATLPPSVRDHLPRITRTSDLVKRSSVAISRTSVRIRCCLTSWRTPTRLVLRAALRCLSC